MPNRKLKIYLVAGEPSGDALGARLMRALKKKTDGNVAFSRRRRRFDGKRRPETVV